MAIETRPYFLLGDLLGCLIAGAVAAFAALLVPSSWWMAPSMAVAMVAGMLAGLLVGVLIVPLFGMESMPPAMMTGMASGMIVSMTDLAADPRSALVVGAAIGGAVFVGMYVLNAVVSGRDRRWSS